MPSDDHVVAHFAPDRSRLALAKVGCCSDMHRDRRFLRCESRRSIKCVRMNRTGRTGQSNFAQILNQPQRARTGVAIDRSSPPRLRAATRQSFLAFVFGLFGVTFDANGWPQRGCPDCPERHLVTGFFRSPRVLSYNDICSLSPAAGPMTRETHAARYTREGAHTTRPG